MAALSITPTERRYVGMGDVELVRELYETIGKLEDDRASDHLYWLVGEVLERWAPQVEWAETELSYRHDEDKDTELEAHAEALKRRRLMREVYAEANEKAAAVLAEHARDV